jgi:hypothetical protein
MTHSNAMMSGVAVGMPRISVHQLLARILVLRVQTTMMMMKVVGCRLQSRSKPHAPMSTRRALELAQRSCNRC